MISVDFCQLMARYNHWQNTSLLAAAETLDHEQRWQDRGAFFGSIAATLNHILLDDALWLERLAGNERPEDSLSFDLCSSSDWAAFKNLRKRRDDELCRWTLSLKPSDLVGHVGWFPEGGLDRIEKPRAVCIVHLFNHQTHHRGQVHCMLTSAGAVPEPTDLPLLR